MTDRKKVAVIGRGTAGAVSIISMLKQKHYIHKTHLPHEFCYDMEWYYDSSINPQPVGEGSTLGFPALLNKFYGLTYDDFSQLDYTPKNGIHYYNFGRSDFLEEFLPGSSALHFNAIKFQEHVLNSFSDITYDKNVSHDDIDADYIIDCSGRPTELNNQFIVPDYICVNSVHVTQCPWSGPTFFHTKTIARPWGWVFMVPLTNRCSVGYLYNNNFCSLEDVKEDVLNVFDQWSLDPGDSPTTNSFSFKNYYRKKTYDGRVVYNGNQNFFLEPMEATSIDSMMFILHQFPKYLNGVSQEKLNKDIRQWFIECEYIIMMHYAAGSKWKNAFWDYAVDRGKKCMENAASFPHIQKMIDMTNHKHYQSCVYENKNLRGFINSTSVGPWKLSNLKQNFEGLGFDQYLYGE